MIQVVEVTHHYGVRPVLRGVSLRIETGEVIALMGPNGMGKSTLLGIMAGVMSPLQGHVEIDGRVRRRTAEEELEVRKKCVYLPAEAFVPAGMACRDWLFAVGRLYEIEQARLIDHIERLLDLFSLVKEGDSPTSSLSTGQKRKIALCSAFVTEAPVMLLDEPFSGGLDPSAILALKGVLQSLAARDDITIVLATPVPELVEGIADRVALIQDGRILAYDTIDGLRRLSGCAGPLDQVYERILSPGTQAKIERYLGRPGA